MDPQLIQTSDGSHTLYLKEIDEHYHSVNGAITESKHVFLNCGFLFSEKKEIKILEVGFGTGLNCLLTAMKSAEINKKVVYVAVEKNPLGYSIHENLNYSLQIDNSSELYNEIVHAQWESFNKLTDNFTLGKFCIDVVNDKLPEYNLFDLIYFDAFAPSKQSEMWTVHVLRKISELTAPGGIFMTYCSKGEVRRILESVGFNMEKLPGPPGKREILRGIKKYP